MKAIIIGGDGKLGQTLAIRLNKAIVTSRRPNAVYPLDLLNPRFPKQIDGGTIYTVFHVAAVTSIIQCERDPDTWRVNADAPASLARQAQVLKYPFIFVSSDAVECAPHLAYAKQKAYAELAVLNCEGCVVRPGRIGPEQYGDVADLLIDTAKRGLTGVVRWQPIAS